MILKLTPEVGRTHSQVPRLFLSDARILALLAMHQDSSRAAVCEDADDAFREELSAYWACSFACPMNGCSDCRLHCRDRTTRQLAPPAEGRSRPASGMSFHVWH